MAAFNNDGKLKLPIMVGNDLGETMGNIIAKSCFSVIGAKRLHIPTLTFGFSLSRLGNAQASLAFRSLLHRFHMEAGNRCKDECLPEETNRRIVDIISDVNMAYSEHARRYLADTGLPKERTYVTGSPMAEPTHERVQYQAVA